MKLAGEYLKNVSFEFHRYKTYGDKTLEQLNEEQLHWRPSENDNSISLLVKHMAGNMLSRWTNFLNEDGEKEWRNRDEEFENPPQGKDDVIKLWNEGWQCLFNALDAVSATNFDSKIKIRGENHTIIEAFNRQLAHYASHVGQIILLGKLQKGDSWISLSVPKGKSAQFNQKMFSKNS